MSEWIRTRDAMPEMLEDVWMITSYGRRFIGSWGPSGDAFVQYSNVRWGRPGKKILPLDKIKWWQPLPELPKDGDR